MKIKGWNNDVEALLNLDNIDEATYSQIVELADSERYANNKIVMMPDAHAGTPAPIGLTMKIDNPLDKFPFELVGNDIGCGVTSIIFKTDRMFTTSELTALYRDIEKEIKTDVNDENIAYDFIRDTGSDFEMPVSLNCGEIPEYEWRTFGTLGGGNHFIELGEVAKNTYMLSVHSGSRGLGAFVYKKYQEIAKKGSISNVKRKRKEIIDFFLNRGLDTMIEDVLKNVPEEYFDGNGYLNNDDVVDYLEDMEYAVEFAEQSRLSMLLRVYVLISMIQSTYTQETIISTHNYYNVDDRVLRKGAVRSDGLLVTPLSMNKGIIISEGIPTADNNFSAPHGAGRIMSRKVAKENITLDSLIEDMEGIITNVRDGIIDESPRAYKNYDELKYWFDKTMQPIAIADPILNFKGE